MNVRAATLFFWGFLIAGAAVAGEEYRSEIKLAIETGGDDPQVFEWHSDDPDADLSKLEVGEIIFIDGRELSGAKRVHGEHKVIVRKEIEKTTN